MTKTHPTDADIQRCADALPAAHAEIVRKVMSLPGNLLVCDWAGETLRGFVLGLARPTAAMLRLRAGWVAPGEDIKMVASGLAGQLEVRSRAAGLMLWRRDAHTLMGQELAAHFGLAPAEQRWLVNTLADQAGKVPYWRQTTPFTCGPSSLMMGMAALQPDYQPDRHAEIQLWREAASIAGLTGPGGCDPLGLALAAKARGLVPRVFTSTDEPMLLERADTEEKRDLIRFVQSEFRDRVQDAGISVIRRAFALEDLQAAFAEDEVVLVLVSQRLTHGRDSPHWILLHGCEGENFLASDPWTESVRDEGRADVSDLPIAFARLDDMAWYGAPPYRAAVMLGRMPADG